MPKADDFVGGYLHIYIYIYIYLVYHKKMKNTCNFVNNAKLFLGSNRNWSILGSSYMMHLLENQCCVVPVM